MPRRDVEALSPADAAVALRSFPRRYRQALTDDHTGELVDAVAWSAGPDGEAPMTLLVDTVRSLALIDRSFEQTVVEDRPVLLRAVLDEDERHFDVVPGQELDDLLIELGLVCSTFAERIERTDAAAWNRPAAVVGGDEVTALDVVREAVRTGGDNLRRLAPLVRALVDG